MTIAVEPRARTKFLWLSDVNETAVTCVCFLHLDNILPSFLIWKCVFILLFYPLYADILLLFLRPCTTVISLLWPDVGIYEIHNTVFFSKWPKCVILMITDMQARLSPVTMVPNSSSFKIEKTNEYFKFSFKFRQYFESCMLANHSKSHILFSFRICWIFSLSGTVREP
jgi:hypothetical protein